MAAGEETSASSLAASQLLAYSDKLNTWPAALSNGLHAVQHPLSQSPSRHRLHVRLVAGGLVKGHDKSGPVLSYR